MEYIAAVQDVTARRLSEEALDKARAQLAQVARATSLGVLTASIAHELNQPLCGIITNANTCLQGECLLPILPTSTVRVRRLGERLRLRQSCLRSDRAIVCPVHQEGYQRPSWWT